LRSRRVALIQLPFEIRVFRRFEPRRQPDVAEHLPGFHQLAVEKRFAFQTFFALAGELAVLVHLIKRLDQFVLLNEIIDDEMKKCSGALTIIGIDRVTGFTRPTSQSRVTTKCQPSEFSADL
jgi:hypothetical protein